jgi:hypothetical protein
LDDMDADGGRDRSTVRGALNFGSEGRGFESLRARHPFEHESCRIRSTPAQAMTSQSVYESVVLS